MSWSTYGHGLRIQYRRPERPYRPVMVTSADAPDDADDRIRKVFCTVRKNDNTSTREAEKADLLDDRWPASREKVFRREAFPESVVRIVHVVRRPNESTDGPDDADDGFGFTRTPA